MRKVLRGIRITAFAFAALLVCLLISRVLTVDPTRPQNNNILDEASGDQPNVPPPPALPESKTVPPASKPAGHSRPAKARPPVRTAQTAPQEDAPIDPRPVIIREADSGDDASAPASPAATLTASVEEPKGPVIVAPFERPKENSRGVRWLKAVGHALGINRPKDPAEEAFR